MAKRPDITTVSQGYYGRVALNQNFENLQEGFDNTLSLDGSTPNAMNADLDMNSNDILNASSVDTARLLINGSEASTSELVLSALVIAQEYATVAALLASTDTYTAGAYVHVVEGDYYYKAAASGDVTNAGGQQFEVLPGADGSINWLMFGADNTGATDISAIMTACDTRAVALGCEVKNHGGSYRLSDAVTLSGSVRYTSAGGGRNYANPTRSDGVRVLLDFNDHADCITMTGDGTLRGSGGCWKGHMLTSYSGVAGTDLSSKAIHAFVFDGLFMYEVETRAEHLNVSRAFTGARSNSGSPTGATQNNALQIDNVHIALIGDTTGALVALTGGHTYGQGIDLANAPDSRIGGTPYIEECGLTTITMGSNCQISDSFTDLSGGPVSIGGENGSIVGSSIKWARNRAVAIGEAGARLVGNVLKGANYENDAGTGDAAMAVRLQSGAEGFIIANNDMNDELPGSAPHNVKTRYQSSFHTGSAGNWGLISGNVIGPAEAAGNNIYDPNNNLGLGNIMPWGNAFVSDGTDWTKGVELRNSGVVSVGETLVRGTSTCDAIRTTTSGTIINGRVVSKGNGTGFDGRGGSTGPIFIFPDGEPASEIAVKNGTGGSAEIEGFDTTFTYSHTGSGSNENVDMFTLPDRMVNALVSVNIRASDTQYAWLAAVLQWDGTTLTVTTSQKRNSGLSPATPFFVDNSGSLAVRIASVSAASATATLRVRGALSYF